MEELIEHAEVGGIRCLSDAEVDSVSGGIIPFLVGVAVGAVGYAVYDAYEEEIHAAVDSAMDAVGDVLVGVGEAIRD